MTSTTPTKRYRGRLVYFANNTHKVVVMQTTRYRYSIRLYAGGKLESCSGARGKGNALRLALALAIGAGLLPRGVEYTG